MLKSASPSGNRYQRLNPTPTRSVDAFGDGISGGGTICNVSSTATTIIIVIHGHQYTRPYRRRSSLVQVCLHLDAWKQTTDARCPTSDKSSRLLFPLFCMHFIQLVRSTHWWAWIKNDLLCSITVHSDISKLSMCRRKMIAISFPFRSL